MTPAPPPTQARCRAARPPGRPPRGTFSDLRPAAIMRAARPRTRTKARVRAHHPQETSPMAKAYEVPPGVDIAALKNKKTGGAGALDLMKPGPGTPWEDRGAQGIVKAFIQTCAKSITSPGLLLDHIRRPDTSREGTQFAIGCAVLWGLSALVHMVLYYTFSAEGKQLVEDLGTGMGSFYIKGLILGAIVGGLVYVLFVLFANRMYFAMVSTELKNTAPRVLLYNMFCYCLGPSILAPIPVIGPPAALLLIFIDWIVGGSKRLYISYRGAIVAAVLTMIGCLVVLLAGVWLTNLVANNVLNLRVEPPIDHDPMSPTFGQPLPHK
jgi:hypothetical protein